MAFDVIRPSQLSILARLVDADGTLDTFEFDGDEKFGIVRTGASATSFAHAHTPPNLVVCGGQSAGLVRGDPPKAFEDSLKIGVLGKFGPKIKLPTTPSP